MSEAGKNNGERKEAGLPPAAKKVCIAITLAPLILMLCKALQPDQIFVGRWESIHFCDMVGFHIPIRHFYAEQLRNGRFPLWMSETFCGWDIAGEGQLGAFHPFHIFSSLFLGWEWTIKLEVAAAFLMGYAGMFLFLRRFMRTEAALLGAVGFVFSSCFAWRIMHLNFLTTLAHLPVGLWCVVKICEGRRPSTWVCGLGIVLGSQLLFGFPQAVWFSGLAWTAAIIVMGGMNRRVLLRFSLSMALGAAIGCVQLAATMVYYLHSSRRFECDSFIFGFSLPPSWYATLFYPLASRCGFCTSHLSTPWSFLNPVEFTVYCGIVPIFLAIMSLQNSDGRNHKLWQLAVIFIFAGAILALGRYFPPFILVKYLPVIGRFRAPARHTVFLVLGISMLCAWEYDRMMSGRQKRNESSRIICVITAILSLAALGLLLFFLRQRAAAEGCSDCPNYADEWLRWQYPHLILAIITATILVAYCSRRFHALPLCILPALLCLDLGILSLTFPSGRTIPRDDFSRVINNLPDIPSARPPFRIMTPRDKYLPLIMKGYRLAMGYAGAYPEKPPYSIKDVDGARLCSVGAFLWLKHPCDIIMNHVENPLPRAYLLPSESLFPVSPDVADLTPLLPSLDPHRQAFVYRADGGTTIPPATGEGDKIGSATIVADHGESVRIEVSASRPAALILTDRDYPGWIASVNGIGAPIRRVNGLFRTVEVPQGRSIVEFKYRPWWVMFGGCVTIIGLVFTLCVLGIEFRKSSRYRRTGAK